MTLPVAGREYVIITKTLKTHTFNVEKYTGKCDGAYAGGIDWLFLDIARVKTPYDVKLMRIFTKWDEYLELTEMNKISNMLKSMIRLKTDSFVTPVYQKRDGNNVLWLYLFSNKYFSRI